jgi:heme oxygenase
MAEHVQASLATGDADAEAAGMLAILRRHTERMHRELDERMRPLTSLDAYVGYLTGMAQFMAVAVRADPALLPFVQSRFMALQADLDTLGAERAQHPVRDLRTTEAEALGWNYVFSGSTLGARHLCRTARAQPFARDAMAFLDLHCGAGDWPRFLARASSAASTDRTRACAGALAAFACAHRAFHIPRTAIWK